MVKMMVMKWERVTIRVSVVSLMEVKDTRAVMMMCVCVEEKDTWIVGVAVDFLWLLKSKEEKLTH